MTSSVGTQPHGHLKRFLKDASFGSLMRARNSTGALLGRGIHVGDVFCQVPTVGVGTTLTTVVATDYTKSGMATLDETGVLGVIQTLPATMSITATISNENFARCWVILPATSSRVKAVHGMEAAAVGSIRPFTEVSTKEPLPGAVAASLAAIDEDVRATCGPGIVLAKVRLPDTITALVAGTPLVAYGPGVSYLSPLARPDIQVGARIVGYLHRSIVASTEDGIILAEVDFDGEHGFGMVCVNPTP